MSWSYKIIFLYLSFVGLIVSLVVISSRNKEELVAPDYYEQEIAYQDRIEAMRNEASLVESIDHQVISGGLLVKLPKDYKVSQVSVTITFYCPSDSKKDRKINMAFNELGRQEIAGLAPGNYQLRLGWNYEGKEYYKEHTIRIK